jgi:copper homeostasis protein
MGSDSKGALAVGAYGRPGLGASPFSMPILLEACLDSASRARVAERGGAGRIELCDRLDVGGTTPSISLIEATVSATNIPVNVILRPRGGDFRYSSAELDMMKREAEALKRLGAAGIVLGILASNGTVDAARTREVMDAANGLSATFHLAFEQVPDPREGLETLIDLGVERLLTAGGSGRALDGADAIRALVEQSAGRIAIMAGGSIREPNVAEIVRRTGVREIHTRGWAVAEILERANSAAAEMRRGAPA